jgi:hypothetical protein
VIVIRISGVPAQPSHRGQAGTSLSCRRACEASR